MKSIPDDGTMESALYGSAHIETALARENGEKMVSVFRERIDRAYSELDLELADVIMSNAPELVMSDRRLRPQEWPKDVIETVETLRYIERQTLGLRLVRSWVEEADHRGRLIGLGEHSARMSVSGKADESYKAAVLRGGTGQ